DLRIPQSANDRRGASGSLVDSGSLVGSGSFVDSGELVGSGSFVDSGELVGSGSFDGSGPLDDVGSHDAVVRGRRHGAPDRFAIGVAGDGSPMVHRSAGASALRVRGAF